MTIIMLDAAAEQDNTVHIGAASQFRLRGKRSIFLILGRVLADVRGLFDVVTSRATLGAKGTDSRYASPRATRNYWCSREKWR